MKMLIFGQPIRFLLDKDTKMKLLISIILTINFAITAFAYNEKEYARLFVTKSCQKCDLYKANFAGANLTNFDFTGSNLIRVNFQNATLYGVKLDDANITGANFSGAMWIDGAMCQEGSYGKCIKHSSGN